MYNAVFAVQFCCCVSIIFITFKNNTDAALICEHRSL